MMPQCYSRAAITALVLGLPAAAHAQSDSHAVGELIVTATRADDPPRADLIGSSVTVISPPDIVARQVRIVSDVLRDVPGVSVSRQGGVGNFTQVRIRGVEANHTLTLIDGIEAADPFQGEFDYANLIADEVARIEVLRGQQSALYGSDAIGGVIHYMTPSGAEVPGARLRLEAGSLDTVVGSARIGGQRGDVDYVLSGGYQTTAGDVIATHGVRDIGSKLGALSGKLAWTLTDSLRIKAVARFSSTIADLNSQDFLTFEVLDNPSSYSRSHSTAGLLRAELGPVAGPWTGALSVQGVDAKRDGYAADVIVDGDEGSRIKGALETTLRFGAGVKHSVTAAIDLERETFQNTSPPSPFGADTTRRSIENVGIVLEYNLRLEDRLGLGAAVRHDDNDVFADAVTYRLQATYRLEGGLRLRAAAGSGIRNPSQTELFGYNAAAFPFVGNPNLKPERSEGWEIGAEHRVGDSGLIGATYFRSTLQDEIFTDFSVFPTTANNQTTESEQQGVEVFVGARLGRAWRLDAAYTWLDAREAGSVEIRRPEHVASLNLGWAAQDERLGANLTVRYNGAALDSDFSTFPAATRRLEAFTLVNLAGHWNRSDRLQLFARVENLLDEDYQEVFNYRSAGRAAYAGVRARF